MLMHKFVAILQPVKDPSPHPGLTNSAVPQTVADFNPCFAKE